MVKKFSRRSIRAFAIVCLLLSVVCLWSAESANAFSQFAATQQLQVQSTGWNIVCVANYTAGTWSCLSWVYGNNTFSFSSPYGAYKDFFLYDLDSGRFVEDFLIQDNLR